MRKNELRREKEYRISFKRTKGKDDLRQLNILLKRLNSIKKSKDVSYSSLVNHQQFLNSNFITTKQQHCVVKVRYSNQYSSHVKFLKTYMPQKDKVEVNDKPKLFGNISQAEYEAKIQKEKQNIILRNGKKKNISKFYKFILSPEKKLSEEDLKLYTKLLVEELEVVTGEKFIWQAVVHTNTDNPHVHLLIDGKDSDGKDVYISNKIRTQIARELSQKILTKMLGERTIDEIEGTRKKRLKANRLTEYDNDIKIFEKELSTEEKIKYGKYFEGSISAKSGDLGVRLDYLESIGYAKFFEGKYFLKKNWQENLRIVGKYNKFEDARNWIAKDYELKMYSSDMGKIKGRIVHTYTMNDEDVWNNSIILQDDENHVAYFIPSYRPLSRKLEKAREVEISKPVGKKDIDVNVTEWN